MKKYQGETVHPLSVMQYCPKCGHAGFVVNDERSKKCEKCGFTFYLNCATAVAGVIMKGESLLLTRRAEEPYKGMWDLPGGFVEFDETPEEALVREVKEELSLKIRVKHYLFSHPNVYAFSSVDVRTTDLFFRCEVEGSESFVPSDDVSEARFVPLREIDVQKIGLSSIRKAVTFLQNHREILEK